MRITKRQLRAIIGKEKRKLLKESRQGERALGIYADTAETDALKKQIHAFIENVWGAAEADGVDEDEAGEMAELAFADLAAEAVGTMGMMRLRRVLQSVERHQPHALVQLNKRRSYNTSTMENE